MTEAPIEQEVSSSPFWYFGERAFQEPTLKKKKKIFFTTMGQFCGLAKDRNRDKILERQRPVFDAIEKGDMQAMHQCLQDMKNENEEKKEGTKDTSESFVNWTNKEGKTPVLVACEYARMNMLRYFHSPLNASLCVSDKFGNNAFHVACMSGHLQVVKWLLETRNDSKWKSKNPDSLDWQSRHPKNQVLNSRGETPLHLAASSNSRDASKVVNWLLTPTRVRANEIHYVKHISMTHQDVIPIDQIRTEQTFSGRNKALGQLVSGDRIEIRGEGNDSNWYAGIAVQFQDRASSSNSSNRKTKSMKRRHVVVRYARASRFSLDAVDKEENTVLHCACKGGT